MSQSEVQYDSTKINLNKGLKFFKPLDSKSKKILRQMVQYMQLLEIG